MVSSYEVRRRKFVRSLTIMSATLFHRRVTSPLAPISRWKIAPKVCWFVTLNMPKAAIAM